MIGRHLAEFQRALRNNEFEVAESGLFFPNQKVFVGGLFAMSHNDGAWEEFPNLIVAQGRVYEQTAALLNGSAQANWYIAPYAANVAPADNLTAATFTATMTEFTNYTEANRQQWVKNAAGSVAGTCSNTDAPAVITVGNGVQVNVYGAGLVSVQGKSATTGILYAAALATKPKLNLDETDTLAFKYTIALTSS